MSLFKQEAEFANLIEKAMESKNTAFQTALREWMEVGTSLGPTDSTEGLVRRLRAKHFDVKSIEVDDQALEYEDNASAETWLIVPVKGDMRILQSVTDSLPRTAELNSEKGQIRIRIAAPRPDSVKHAVETGLGHVREFIGKVNAVSTAYSARVTQEAHDTVTRHLDAHKGRPDIDAAMAALKIKKSKN